MTTRAFASSPVVATAGRRPLPAAWADRLVDTHVERAPAGPPWPTCGSVTPTTGCSPTRRSASARHCRSARSRPPDRSRIRIFAGEVTRVACEVDDDGTFTLVRAQDLGHRLTRGRRLAVWKRTTLRQVVEDVAKHAS